jgi:hypothetical protein
LSEAAFSRFRFQQSKTELRASIDTAPLVLITSAALLARECRAALRPVSDPHIFGVGRLVEWRSDQVAAASLINRAEPDKQP